MSSCSDRTHCKKWLSEHHHQRQQSELRWRTQKAKGIHEQVGQSWDWKWLSTKKDCLDIQSTWSSTLWWNLGKDCFKVAKRSWLQSWTTEASWLDEKTRGHHSCHPVNATMIWGTPSKRLKQTPTWSWKDGLANTFRNVCNFRYFVIYC